jgi:F-type H+-transporting ATPase subunit epsilon
MAESIELEVVTPERSLVHESVTEVEIPGKDGYMGVLPGHAPLLSLLGSGFLSYTVQGSTRFLSVHGGFVEVLPDHVRVLADEAERAEDIDLAAARAELQRANEELGPGAAADPALALATVARAQARVTAAEKAGKA